MGFKMKKMNFGKGTGSVNGLPKRGASLNASNPAYENFASRLQSGEVDWSDHPDYNPNFQYDRFGNPITNVQGPTTSNLGTSDHIFGSIDRSVNNTNYAGKGEKHRSVEEEPTQERIDKAISKYRKAEQRHGAGNVSRGDMTDIDFDILLNYGGTDGGSWIQERMINSAKGIVDSEPHLQGKFSDMQMYPDLKEGEVPSLRKIHKNFSNMYMGVMNDSANADFVPGYESPDFIDKRTAKNLAKELIPDYSLTSTPKSLTDPIPSDQDLTDEQEDAEVKEVKKEMESKEFKELANKPTVEIENDKKLVEKTSGKEEEYVPITQRFKPDDTPDDPPPADDDSSASGLEGDYNNDGVVDYLDKRFAPMNKKIIGNPFQYGTDSYYKYQKQQRSKNLGLTKRPLNIHGRI